MLPIFGLMVVVKTIPVGGFEVAGAGGYLPAPELTMECAVWGVAEESGDARLERCRAFMPLPGPLQSALSASVVLQAYWPCHLGMDNLNVAKVQW